jgi:hypothetical protein
LKFRKGFLKSKEISYFPMLCWAKSLAAHYSLLFIFLIRSLLCIGPPWPNTSRQATGQPS